MPTATWKGIERAVAAELEGSRVPSSGNGAIKGDIVQMRLVPDAIAESKHGAQVPKAGPKQLEGWLLEAERDAATAGVIGSLLYLHPPRARIIDGLVVLRLGVLSHAQRNLRAEIRQVA